jgi:hypothetical protein
METMHAAGRRTLPPVPRATGQRTSDDDARIRPPAAPAPRRNDEAVTPEPSLDAAQSFVERLRSSANDFAEAAGAESAVVREAVPPARHRRARCRVVLRYADDNEVDVTFLGPTGAPGTPSRHGFDRQIRRWFASGQPREAAWLVTDEDASGGFAIDVAAWRTAD